MMVHPRALIAFASTSGSTREVARLAANALPGMEVVLLDLGDPSARSAAPAGQRYDLVVAGTPSYGFGDWHAAWERHHTLLRPTVGSAGCVMLFALGDARGHAASFAGGLRALHGSAHAAGAALTGATAPMNAAEYRSPALVAGRLPGLALEYRRDRRAAAQRLSAWLAQLPPEWRRLRAGAATALPCPAAALR